MIKKYIKKREEDFQRRMEIRTSVNCPYCSRLYSRREIYNNSIREHEVDKHKTHRFLRCKDCNKMFGVETTNYYEPTPSTFNCSFKVSEEKSEENSSATTELIQANKDFLRYIREKYEVKNNDFECPHIKKIAQLIKEIENAKK